VEQVHRAYDEEMSRMQLKGICIMTDDVKR
jgi:hypothetical protein